MERNSTYPRQPQNYHESRRPESGSGVENAMVKMVADPLRTPLSANKGAPSASPGANLYGNFLGCSQPRFYGRPLSFQTHL